MNIQQEIAPDVDERILSAFLVSFIHQDRGRPNTGSPSLLVNSNTLLEMISASPNQSENRVIRQTTTVPGIFSQNRWPSLRQTSMSWSCRLGSVLILRRCILCQRLNRVKGKRHSVKGHVLPER